MQLERLATRAALAIACGLAMGACGSPPPGEAGRGTGPASGAPGAPSRQRLFLESRAEDDEARSQRLTEIIRKDGAPCEGADKVAMVTSGVWTVRCGEGAVYRVIFDRQGKLIEARKLTD